MNLRHPRHLRLRNHLDKLSFHSANGYAMIFRMNVSWDDLRFARDD